jgi:hypothetical protein
MSDVHEEIETGQAETERHIAEVDEVKEEKHALEHQLEAERHESEHARLREEIYNGHDHSEIYRRLDDHDVAIAALVPAVVEHEAELEEHAEVIDEHADVLEDVLEGEPVEGAESAAEASEAGGAAETGAVESDVLTVVPSTVDDGSAADRTREVAHTRRRHWGR